MPKRTSLSGSELFIVDNSDEDWKVLRYLHDWCQLSKSIDCATGYFEIGSLLSLKDEWQKVGHFRILMGDEVTRKTKNALAEGLARIKGRLDNSLEAEKLKNDFLTGVPAIVEAIRSGKIACRVYRKEKFHAKAYITHARLEVIGSSALVGSSNFTYPGLTENVELNVQITGQPVGVLQEWYEEHWAAAEDVTPEILRVIERHTREYSPFEVYVKALAELFRGHELTELEWEEAGPQRRGSRMFPYLDYYQKQGYRALMKRAREHAGAFLCDGVGLGKTFIGLMVIERLIEYEHKRVVLIVPKGARDTVWEPALKRYMNHLYGPYCNLEVLSHTDLLRGGDFPQRLAQIKERADAVVIDEAHHFRNPGAQGAPALIADEETAKGQIRGKVRLTPSRYRKLYDLIESTAGLKEVYLLTATPINNKLADFRHMVELFSRQNDNYFNRIGIHSLRGHFGKMEKDLKASIANQGQSDPVIETDMVEAQQLLSADSLFQALVVQRSRAYVKQSQLQQGATVTSFPEREAPRVADYSVKKTYGRLLTMIDEAFDHKKPLFCLAVYYPLAYYKGPNTSIDKFEENRQEQVVGLIRTQFLKRFESSVRAFEMSCERLLVKLLAFVKRYATSPSEKKSLNAWEHRNSALTDYVLEHQLELFGGPDNQDDPPEDLITEEMLEEVIDLDPAEYDISDMIMETFQDLDQLAQFLGELRKFKPQHDDKLNALVKLLKSDPVLSKHKALLFTEFADTARYLREQLEQRGIEGLDEVDGGTKLRNETIRRFAPYYNESSSTGLKVEGLKETRILISTDVLSEGLNLQDATRLINYDIHWNPVRLMQRIGRVDRRLNPEVEARLVQDHPEVKSQRGTVVYWNFLPPEELDGLLLLYGKVAHKTLRISKTLGIEGKKLLRPEDDFEALKEFNHEYDGVASALEKADLEYQALLTKYPDLADRIKALPGRVFSGKQHPSPGAQGVFFCYALPGAERVSGEASAEAEVRWSEEAGPTRWYLYDLRTEKIEEEPARIIGLIRSEPDTPRHCTMDRGALSEIRGKLEKHIKNTYLKQVQAPIGVSPNLKAWLELS